jgi:hypothetical protein
MTLTRRGINILRLESHQERRSAAIEETVTGPVQRGHGTPAELTSARIYAGILLPSDGVLRERAARLG